MTSLTCFKAYDIRGRLGVDLDAGIARRIGAAFAHALGASRVVVGRDCRASSEELMQAVVDGLVSAGAEVIDLGLCGTEEMYFRHDAFRRGWRDRGDGLAQSDGLQWHEAGPPRVRPA